MRRAAIAVAALGLGCAGAEGGETEPGGVAFELAALEEAGGGTVACFALTSEVPLTHVSVGLAADPAAPVEVRIGGAAPVSLVRADTPACGVPDPSRVALAAPATSVTLCATSAGPAAPPLFVQAETTVTCDGALLPGEADQGDDASLARGVRFDGWDGRAGATGGARHHGGRGPCPGSYDGYRGHHRGWGDWYGRRYYACDGADRGRYHDDDWGDEQRRRAYEDEE